VCPTDPNGGKKATAVPAPPLGFQADRPVEAHSIRRFANRRQRCFRHFAEELEREVKVLGADPRTSSQAGVIFQPRREITQRLSHGVWQFDSDK
jgi:hypothetical protein